MGMSARILRNEIYETDLHIGYYRLFFGLFFFLETSGYFILSIVSSKSADDSHLLQQLRSCATLKPWHIFNSLASQLSSCFNKLRFYFFLLLNLRCHFLFYILYDYCAPTSNPTMAGLCSLVPYLRWCLHFF